MAITTAVTRNRPTTCWLAHPQEPPLEIPSNRAVSAIDSSSAPMKSNLPFVRTVDSETSSSTPTISSAPVAADVQKMACQPNCSKMMPDNGSPSAAPIPRVALIRATAEPTFSFGSSSRMMLIPIGMSAAAKPCSARPMITVR